MRPRLVVTTVLLAVVLVVAGWQLRTQQQLRRGESAFTRLGCASCHLAGGGPDLRRAARKYDREMLVRFIQNPDAVYASRGNRPLNEGWMQMPSPHASAEDAEAISYYLQHLATD